MLFIYCICNWCIHTFVSLLMSVCLFFFFFVRNLLHFMRLNFWDGVMTMWNLRGGFQTLWGREQLLLFIWLLWSVCFPLGGLHLWCRTQCCDFHSATARSWVYPGSATFLSPREQQRRVSWQLSICLALILCKIKPPFKLGHLSEIQVRCIKSAHLKCYWTSLLSLQVY